MNKEEKKENKWTLILKGIFTIIMYLCYEDISGFIYKLLNIDVSKLSRNYRILTIASGEILCLLTLIIIYRKELLTAFKKLRQKLEEYAFFGGKIWLIGAFIMSMSSYIVGIILNKPISDNENAVRELIKLFPMYMLYSTVIFAPIVEELVARKALRDIIKNDILFLLISGLSFGMLHVIFTYERPLDFLYAIPYSAMGTAFAYMYLKTKNIALPISIHMIHNAALVIMQIIGG